MKPSKALVVILAYNAEKTLTSLLNRIPKDFLDQSILADDGSTDQTMNLAGQLHIKSFTHTHSGYGGNLKFAFLKALELGADYVFEIHGDDQYNPAAIIPAFEKLKQGTDLVLGSRFTESGRPLEDGMPKIKYLANKVLSWIDRILFNLPLTEFHTGFKGISRNFLEKLNLNLFSDDFLFDFQIIAAAKYLGAKITEVPVRCLYHKDASSINLGRSTIYAAQTFIVLAKYLLAKIGFPGKFFKHGVKNPPKRRI